jgi:hypothetical protein
MALGSCAFPFYCMMVSYSGLICLNLQKNVRFSSICFVIFLSECCSHWFFFFSSSSKVGETSNEFSCMVT